MSDKKKPVNPKKDEEIKDESSDIIRSLTDALQRERADSVNLRRQSELSLNNARQLAIVKVVRELLPAIDNLERALLHVPKEFEGSDYIKGVESVIKQFEKSFAVLNIQRIKTVGMPFDPRYHEAVNMDDSLGGSKEIVSAELQSGYMVGDEVVRHAMVNVVLKD